MLRSAALVLLLCVSWPAHADWFYRFVGYTCDQANDRLVIHYKGAYNDEGEAMRESKLDTEWEPDSLIASMKDDDHIGKLKTITRTCKLKHANYRLRLGPTPGNFNIQGRCGANIAAWVEVRRGLKLVLPRYELEGDCHDSSAPVTTEIVFTNAPPPAFIRVPRSDFIR